MEKQGISGRANRRLQVRHGFKPYVTLLSGGALLGLCTYEESPACPCVCPHSKFTPMHNPTSRHTIPLHTTQHPHTKFTPKHTILTPPRPPPPTHTLTHARMHILTHKPAPPPNTTPHPVWWPQVLCPPAYRPSITRATCAPSSALLPPTPTPSLPAPSSARLPLPPPPTHTASSPPSAPTRTHTYCPPPPTRGCSRKAQQ